MADKTFLLLGGAGLVGLQVARRIAHDLAPERIVIVSLRHDEVIEALDGPSGLRQMFASQHIDFVGEWGDVFVREEFSRRGRTDLLDSYEAREALLADLSGPIEEAYAGSRLVQLILKYRPDVIVDSINTATAISYQDAGSAATAAKQKVDRLLGQLRGSRFDEARHGWKETERAFEVMFLSAAVPQLIRHVILVNQAMREVGTRLYLKIGTTGTGGMGLNIPYTHSEDRPSAQLLTKSAIAFAHTGLLFLMARTVDGPIVKEIKPGAMIGYADITCRTIRDHAHHPMRLYTARELELGDTLPLALDPHGFESHGDLDLPVVDTGENGLFTRGEFETITSVRQMEYVTPEEIALDCALEIRGSNTGRDVIAAIDGAVMSPTYRAGVLRQQALETLARLEKKTGTHSVALGKLGPPELSKLLWEAEILKEIRGTLQAVVDTPAGELSAEAHRLVLANDRIRSAIVSIGVPILTPEGRLLRGPFLKIPEVAGQKEIEIRAGDVDRWAAKGWVDLRPASFAHWQQRFAHMLRASQKPHMRGSAATTREVYPYEEIHIGAVVAWIFNNEMAGYRIK